MTYLSAWKCRQRRRQKLIEIYGGLPRGWMLINARPEYRQRIMLFEYGKLRRGHRHTSVFSKSIKGYRRRVERRFVSTWKQMELQS